MENRMIMTKKSALAGLLVGAGIVFLGLSMLLLPNSKPAAAEEPVYTGSCARDNYDPGTFACSGKMPGDKCSSGVLVGTCMVSGHTPGNPPWNLCACVPDPIGGGW